MEQTIERKDIQETPFSAIHYVEQDIWKVSLANQIIINKEFKTYEDAEMYVMGVNEFPWELIFNATSMFTTYVLKQQQEEKTGIPDRSATDLKEINKNC